MAVFAVWLHALVAIPAMHAPAALAMSMAGCDAETSGPHSDHQKGGPAPCCPMACCGIGVAALGTPEAPALLLPPATASAVRDAGPQTLIGAAGRRHHQARAPPSLA